MILQFFLEDDTHDSCSFFGSRLLYSIGRVQEHLQGQRCQALE